MLSKKDFLCFILLFFISISIGQAQPAEPPADIKALLGFYRGEGDNVIIRERDGRLEFLYGVTVGDYSFDQSNLFQMPKKRYDEYELVIASPRDFRSRMSVKFERDQKGRGITCIVDKQRYSRNFSPGENNNDFKITPAISIQVARENALNAQMPVQDASLMTAQLVDIVKKEPGIKVNMFYAQDKNFVDAAIYESNTAYLHEEAVAALGRVHKKLADYGYGLMVLDAYRPWYISKLFSDILPEGQKAMLETPDKGSPHNRGLSVDVTLYELATGQEVKMISGFDEPSLRAYSKFQGGSELDRFRRDLLRQFMVQEGFNGIGHEWWHFDYKGFSGYRLLNTAFTQLDKG